MSDAGNKGGKAVAMKLTPEQAERLHKAFRESELAFALDYIQEHWGMTRQQAMKFLGKEAPR